MSGNYFDVLGVKPVRGRAFLPEENSTPAHTPVAVISYSFWQRQFGADPNLIGKTITLNELPTPSSASPREVTGTLIERTTDLWVPLMMQPHLIPQGNSVASRNVSWIQIMGRLRDDISLAQAEAGIDVLAQQIKQALNPQSAQAPKLPYSEQHIKLEPGGRGISDLRGELSAAYAAVGSRRIDSVNRVRQRRQPVARAFARTPQRDRRSTGAWRRPRAARSPIVDGKLSLAFVSGVVGLMVAPWITGCCCDSNRPSILRRRPSVTA
ncbi:MAG: ABC transporter permease [Pyrinomonadaceae bacterium]